MKIAGSRWTLNKARRISQRRAEWTAKLYNNCRRKFARIAHLFSLNRRSLSPPREGRTPSITLHYIGEPGKFENAVARVEEVFDVQFKDNFAAVQFSRITLNVLLRPDVRFQSRNAA